MTQEFKTQKTREGGYEITLKLYGADHKQIEEIQHVIIDIDTIYSVGVKDMMDTSIIQVAGNKKESVKEAAEEVIERAEHTSYKVET